MCLKYSDRFSPLKQTVCQLIPITCWWVKSHILWKQRLGACMWLTEKTIGSTKSVMENASESLNQSSAGVCAQWGARCVEKMSPAATPCPVWWGTQRREHGAVSFGKKANEAQSYKWAINQTVGFDPLPLTCGAVVWGGCPVFQELGLTACSHPSPLSPILHQKWFMGCSSCCFYAIWGCRRWG